VRDYLMTIQDPILLPLKDSIRAEGGVQLLEEFQQKFVDIVEGRKADAMAQVKQHHRNIHLTKAPWGNQDRKQPNKRDAGKKNQKKGSGKTQGLRSDGDGGCYDDTLGAQLGPKLTLVSNQPSPIITALNQIGTGNSLVLTTPTVQFGRAAHPAQDEAKVDG
jgi:hypothetical protein